MGRLIKPQRVLYDKASGRTIYIDSRNDAYADRRFTKRVKCGLGHKMWSTGEFLCCENCEKNLNIPKVKCELIPFEETGETRAN